MGACTAIVTSPLRNLCRLVSVLRRRPSSRMPVSPRRHRPASHAALDRNPHCADGGPAQDRQRRGGDAVRAPCDGQPPHRGAGGRAGRTTVCYDSRNLRLRRGVLSRARRGASIACGKEGFAEGTVRTWFSACEMGCPAGVWGNPEAGSRAREARRSEPLTRRRGPMLGQGCGCGTSRPQPMATGIAVLGDVVVSPE